MNRIEPIPALIEEAASHWLVRRNAGLSASEETRFQAWLAADPLHAASFAELSSVWDTISCQHRQPEARQALARLEARAGQRRLRRNMWVSASGIAAAASLALALLLFEPAANTSVPVATVAIKPDRRLLPDGSVLELNSGAEIEVAYTASTRAVRLIHGEVLFEVARDATRPFIVFAGAVQVRAVGTSFTVRLDPRQVDVLVTEGQVAVDRTPEASLAHDTAFPEPLYLASGGRVRIPLLLAPEEPVAIEPVSQEQMAEALAWRGRRIEFTKTTLAEAVVLFNGQNQVQLSISDEGIAQLRVSGIFWADDPEGFVRLLESGFPIRAEHRSGSITLDHRR